MTSVRYLRLHLHLPNGERRSIGYLSQFGDVMRVTFDESYVEDSSRPTLSLLFRGASESDTKEILRASRDVRLVRTDGHWPTWFSHLLPEGHNRERLARARGCTVDDEFELLAAAGRDLAGAVEVEPVHAVDEVPRGLVAWHAALGIDTAHTEAVAAPVEDAASLSGVAEKFSAIQDGRRYVVKRQGKPGAFIIKLPSLRHPDLVDNELTGYRLAESLGLQCAQAIKVSRKRAELPDHIDFPHVLAVKRFDRDGSGRRIHMEELAQAMGYSVREKYGRGLSHDLPATLRLLDRLSARPAENVREAVRRFVAFVLMGNADAHLKNWALIYPDGTNPILSPLYDPVCVTAWFDELAPHEYVLNRNVDRILSALTWDELRSLLDASGVPRASRLMQIAKNTVKQARSQWPAMLRDAPRNLRKSIEARLAGKVALAT